MPRKGKKLEVGRNPGSRPRRQKKRKPEVGKGLGGGHKKTRKREVGRNPGSRPRQRKPRKPEVGRNKPAPIVYRGYTPSVSSVPSKPPATGETIGQSLLRQRKERSYKRRGGGLY